MMNWMWSLALKSIKLGKYGMKFQELERVKERRYHTFILVRDISGRVSSRRVIFVMSLKDR